MRPVVIITIAVITMIGIIGIGYMDSANAEIIRGAGDILHDKPYGCIPYNIDTPNKQNEITITFSAYTRSPDISVAIKIDGQQQGTEILVKQQQNQIYKYFKVSEKNSHELQICLVKNGMGTDERELDITNVNWTKSKVTPPKTSAPNTHTPSTPIPDVVKSIDCALKQNPQFDRYYEYGSELEISIDNPHPNNCKYEVQIYDSAKNYDGAFDSKLISSLFLAFDQQSMSDGEYFIVLKSITDGKSYGYYPLTIVDKTTPIDPTIILIIIAVVAVGIIAVIVSKRKKVTSPPPVDPKHKKESPRTPIHSEPKKEPKKPQKKASPTRPKPSQKTATSSSSSPIGSGPSKTPKEILDELARKINPDYKTKPTSPPPVDPKHATESTKGPIHSEPKKPQKKASPTRQQPSKRTVKPTIDSEKDRILHATNPLDVLGLSPNVSFSVIKSTYRELSIIYDPNRNIINKSDVQKELDQKISVKLNHAYFQLKRQNLG